MKTPMAVCAIFSTIFVWSNTGAADKVVDLKRDGAFGFPQSKAQVLCDQKDLRLSVWNDAKHLAVQAILWTDDDNTLGESDDGRPIGDSSSLCLDVDADQKITPQKDRDYLLNPWPSLQGLRYSVKLGKNASTHIKADSTGRGAIRYIDLGEGKHVRVDTYAIPLTEIERKPGESVGLAFWAMSIKPALTINSIGYKGKERYYSNALPREKYHSIKLAERADAIDVSKWPEGREDKVVLAKKPIKPLAKVGFSPPEITAKDWINIEKAPTLTSLKGKVVVVEFWATWCGPCIHGIPHLNDLHDKYSPKGLAIIGFTDQSRKGIVNFMKQTPIKYAIGTGSELASEYGVHGLPHAFIIGRDGNLIWEGDPGEKEFDEQIIAALKAE